MQSGKQCGSYHLASSEPGNLDLHCFQKCFDYFGYIVAINIELYSLTQCTVQSLYNTLPYNTDLDITQSCCGYQFFLPWSSTKKL